MTIIKNAIRDTAEILAGKRASASMTRGDFLIAVAALGIITEATAEEAADGSWPTDFNAFLSGLPQPKRIAAKAAWADAAFVRRNNPILALIADDVNLQDYQLDALFGIS